MRTWSLKHPENARYTWQIIQEYQIGFVIVPNLVWFYGVMILKLELISIIFILFF